MTQNETTKTYISETQMLNRRHYTNHLHNTDDREQPIGEELSTWLGAL